MTKRVPWNKGLSKSTSPILLKSSNTLKDTLSISGGSFKGKKHSDETKLKLSDNKKRFLEENPDMVPYVLYHFTKTSYPEQYFIECFSSLTNIVHQHRISRYILDFANLESKRYLEVDGELHYCDEAVIQKDIRRTTFLKSKGWECIRVRWKDFSKLGFDRRKLEVDRIKTFITGQNIAD